MVDRDEVEGGWFPVLSSGMVGSWGIIGVGWGISWEIGTGRIMGVSSRWVSGE